MKRFLFTPRIWSWNIFDALYTGFVTGAYLAAMRLSSVYMAIPVWLVAILAIIAGCYFSAMMERPYRD